MVDVTCPTCNTTFYCEVVGKIEESLEYPLTCPSCGKIILSIGNVDIVDFFRNFSQKGKSDSDISSPSRVS